MPQQLTTVRTPASAADVLRAIMDAGVSQSAAYMLAAQSALETAGWSGMWNWNLGNITTTGDYVLLPGNGLHFKAYGSLSEGAADFVSYLASHGVTPYAESGDLDGYVGRLQAIHYAGDADYTAYENGMRSWMQKLGAVAPSMFLTSQAVLASSLLVGGLAVAWGVSEGIFDGVIRMVERTLLRPMGL